MKKVDKELDEGCVGTPVADAIQRNPSHLPRKLAKEIALRSELKSALLRLGFPHEYGVRAQQW